jgi:hypothetical protein
MRARGVRHLFSAKKVRERRLTAQASPAFLLASLTARPLRDLLGLALPAPAGWGLIGAGAAAVALYLLLAAPGSAGKSLKAVAGGKKGRSFFWKDVP